ncbi:MAG TPA: hypothetical protein VEK57_15880 [Thermoanaerobaculia bacterium]|nr:hypothetical protein [Thermoanaerobaculia bacterium]
MSVIDDLLSHVYSTTVTEAAVVVREVRVKVGVLSRPVTIRIFHDPKRPDAYFFECDRVMKTPGETLAPDDPSHFAPTETDALRRAVRTLTEAYESAVRRGQLPDESWLVPGEYR